MVAFHVYLSTEPLDRPLSAFQSKIVDVSPSATVATALEAAGADQFNSFALVTESVQALASTGADDSISGAYNLLGIEKNGTLRYDRTAGTQIGSFLLACDEGYFQGDPHTWVVYPFGSAGGWMPDGLLEVADWLLGQGGTAVVAGTVSLGVTRGWAGAGRIRYRKIRQDWRARGFTAPRVRDLLLKQAQWDENFLRLVADSRRGDDTASLPCVWVTDAGGLLNPCRDALQRRWEELVSIEETGRGLTVQGVTSNTGTIAVVSERGRKVSKRRARRPVREVARSPQSTRPARTSSLMS